MLLKNYLENRGSAKKRFLIPVGIYMFKVNNRNTGTRCEICSKLPIKTPERRFEQVNAHWDRAFGTTLERAHYLSMLGPCILKPMYPETMKPKFVISRIIIRFIVAIRFFIALYKTLNTV